MNSGHMVFNESTPHKQKMSLNNQDFSPPDGALGQSIFKTPLDKEENRKFTKTQDIVGSNRKIRNNLFQVND